MDTRVTHDLAHDDVFTVRHYDNDHDNFVNLHLGSCDIILCGDHPDVFEQLAAQCLTAANLLRGITEATP